jgi:hypothetical protein
MADDERGLIEAVLDGDAERVHALADILSGERTHRVLLGTFVVAVQRLFPGEYTPAQVTAYVADLRGRLGSGDQLKPMPTEAMIRAALDEPDLRDGVSPQDAFNAYLAVTHAYSKDRQIRGLERDEFIREVVETIS